MNKGSGIGIAFLFSLFYVSLYPVLRGESVIHHYPPWSTAQTVTYVVGGILLQAWFCFDRSRDPEAAQGLITQIAIGIVYAAAIALFPGTIYQT